MTENFPSLEKQTSRSRKFKEYQSKEIHIESHKVNFQKSGKGSRKEGTSYIQGNPHKNISIFFSRNFAGQNELNNILKVLKGKSANQETIYVAKLSFNIEGEVRVFQANKG